MALPKNTMTEEEYLAFERESEIRHEYLHGEIFAMSGASRKHNLICVSTTNALFNLLSNGPCEIYQSDMRVKADRLYTYPDICAVCDEPQLSGDKPDTLLNPTLLIEVLSPSTEAYDRGKKFLYYRQIESLREYVLIAQDEPRVERFLRQDKDNWLHTVVSGLEAQIQLESIDCILSLKDAYRKVKFEPVEPEE